MNVDNIVDIDVVSDETARKVYEQIKNLTISQPGDTTEYIDEESKKLIQGYIKSKTKQLNDYYANVADADLPDFMRQYRGAEILSEIDLSISNVNNILSHFKPKDDGRSISDEFKEAKDHLFELESRLYGMGFAPSALQKKAIERIKNGNMEPIDIDDVFEFKNVGSLSLDEKISEYRKTNRELWKNIKIKNDRSSTDINSAIEMINRLREYSDELEKTIPADSIKEEREIKNDISAFNQARADYLLEKETYKARTLSREQGHSEEELNDKELARSKKNMEDLYSKLDNHYNVIVDNTNDDDYKNRETGGNNMGENGGQFEFKDVNSLSLDETILEMRKTLDVRWTQDKSYYTKLKQMVEERSILESNLANEDIKSQFNKLNDEIGKYMDNYAAFKKEYKRYCWKLQSRIFDFQHLLKPNSKELEEFNIRIKPIMEFAGGIEQVDMDSSMARNGEIYLDYRYNLVEEQAKANRDILAHELNLDDIYDREQNDFDYDSTINMIYDEYLNCDGKLHELWNNEKITAALEEYINQKYGDISSDITNISFEDTDFDNDSIKDIQNKTIDYLSLAYYSYKKADSIDDEQQLKDYCEAEEEYLNMARSNLDWIDVRFKLAQIGDIILSDGDENKIGPIVTDIMSKTGAGLLNDNHEYDEYNVQVGLLIIKRSIYNQMESIYRNKGDNERADYYANIAENLRQTYSSLYDEYKNENNKDDDVKFNYSTFEYNGVTYYVGNDLNKDNILNIAAPLKEAVMVNSLKPGENTIGDLPIIINMDENGQITVTKKGKELNVNNFNVLEENNSFDYLKFTSNGVDYYVSNNLNDDNISDIVKSGKNTPCMVSGLKDGKNYIEGVDAVITLENGKLSIEGKGIENVSNNTYEDVKYVSKEAKKQVKKQNARGKNNPENNPKDKDKDNNSKGNGTAALAAGLAADQVVNESKPKRKLIEKLKNSKIGRRIVAGLVAIGTVSAGLAYMVSQLRSEHVNQDITQTQEVNNDYQKPSDSVDSNKDKENTDEKSTTISYNTVDLSNLPVYQTAYNATSNQNPLQANQWFRYNFVDVFDTQTGQYMNLTKDQIKNPEVLSKLLDGHHAILCGESKENPSGFISVEDVYQSLNAESQAALDEAVSQANNTMHR